LPRNDNKSRITKNRLRYCRAATIILPLPPLKSQPDCRSLPIQIVALHPARSEGASLRIEPYDGNFTSEKRLRVRWSIVSSGNATGELQS
jgi:hypothetical protein